MGTLKKTKNEKTTPKTVIGKKSGVSEELQKVVASLNKKFGENTVTIGVPESKKKINRIPTGSKTLDVLIGGGIPEGRYVELSGNESSTKTTQACHILRNAQQLGYVCAFADVEATSDREYFESLGIDCDSLLYFKPDSLEEATECLLQMQKSGVTFAVLDSIANMTTNKEANSTMDETVMMGITPKLLGEFFRKMQANNNRLEREGKTPFTLIGINQLREKIGTYGD